MINSTISIITVSSNDTHASITRDSKTKAALLQVNEDDPWKLFARENIDRIDYNNWILSGNESGRFPIPVDNHIHYCFSFTTDKNSLILAEKQLPMEGCHNFRDLGGIRTRYGKKTRWGSIFRSDEITSLLQTANT